FFHAISSRLPGSPIPVTTGCIQSCPPPDHLIMPNVLVENKNRTTIITLNRPERRNALTIDLMSELSGALEAASTDPTQRVVILRGAGAAFCAGLDLQETTIMEKAHRSAEMVAKT